MSAIVAIQKNGQTVMASDSLICFGGTTIRDEENHSDPKVTKIGKTFCGMAGWGKYGNILTAHLKETKNVKLTNEHDIFLFFHTLWGELHEKYGLVNEQCDDQTDSPFGELDSSFLLANSSGIYYVSSHMSVTKFHKYFAVGSGQDVCLGAIHALYDLDFPAEKIATAAIHAAVSLEQHCGGRVNLFTIE